MEIEIPRIERRWPGQFPGRAAGGEFVQGELAEQHRAGLAQPRGLRHGHESEVGHSGTVKAAGSNVAAGSVSGGNVPAVLMDRLPRAKAAATVSGNSVWARPRP